MQTGIWLLVGLSLLTLQTSKAAVQIVVDTTLGGKYEPSNDDQTTFEEMPEHLNVTFDHEGTSHVIRLQRSPHAAVRKHLYLPRPDPMTTPVPRAFWGRGWGGGGFRPRPTTVCIPYPTGPTPPPCITLLCKCRRCYRSCRERCRRRHRREVDRDSETQEDVEDEVEDMPAEEPSQDLQGDIQHNPGMSEDDHLLSRHRRGWFWGRRRPCCRMSLRCKLLLLIHGPRPNWKYFQ